MYHTETSALNSIRRVFVHLFVHRESPEKKQAGAISDNKE